MTLLLKTEVETSRAYLLTNFLRAPFWAVYNLLMFILYKDLHASAFQIALFIVLKPAVSLISIYWSSLIHGRPDRLVSNIVVAGVIGYMPFLFFPLFFNSWYVIFASAVFMTMHRGVTPAWMELFKRNLKGSSKQKVFSRGSCISYIMCTLLPLGLGPLCDYYPSAWRYLFFATATLSILALFFQKKMAVVRDEKALNVEHSRLSLLDPWKKAYRILRVHRDFSSYQIGFMLLGGSGLMIMQPALPKFFIDNLALSYTELSIAISLCKGVGFALTSSLWARAMSSEKTFQLSAAVAFLGALFPCALMCAQWNHYFVYFAYLLYGVMQAGSELIWHLSGPLFSRQKESGQFSDVNLLVVGVRGSVIPYFGALFLLGLAPGMLLFVGALLCMAGAVWLKKASMRYILINT